MLASVEKLVVWVAIVLRFKFFSALALSVCAVASAQVFAAARMPDREAVKACESDNTELRMVGCTIVIERRLRGVSLASAFDGRCRSYNDLGRFTEALAECRTAIANNRRYSYAYHHLGGALLGLRQFDAAIDAYTQSIALRPNFIYSYLDRARAFAESGRKELARRDYRSVLSIERKNRDANAGLLALDDPFTTPPPQNSGGRLAVAVLQGGGTYEVPVLINNAIRLKFVVDSGASLVSIPADVVKTLLREGSLQPSDFIGQQTFTFADGSTSPSPVFRIRSLRLTGGTGEGITIENVIAAAAREEGLLLLGQSFLSRFKKWSIDNVAQQLLLEW